MMQGRLAALLTAMAMLGGCTAVDDMSGGHPGYQAGFMIAPMPGETLEGVAQRFNVPSGALIAANHLRPPYILGPGQTLIIPPPATYTVRAGDSVEGIATNLGVDEASLARTNGLEEPYEMHVGQVLRVPGGYGAGGVVGPDYAAASQAQTVAPSVTARSAISAEPLSAPPSGATRPGSTALSPPATPAPAALPPQPRMAPPASNQLALAPPAQYGRGAQVSPAPVAAGPIALAPPAARSAPVQPPPPAAVSTPTAQSSATPPSTAGAPHFIRPVSGATLEGFGANSKGQANDGINIAAALGTSVKAAEAGTVIYSGNELPAFGNLVLVRHAGGWVTAYGHLGSIGVQKGATVTQGQPIGTVGQTGGATTPQLHFEIRQNSKPIDPAPFLSGKG